MKFGIKITVKAKGFLNQNVKFTDLGIIIDQPFKFQSQQSILRVVQTTYDRYSPTKYKNFMIVGGVLDVKYFKYLPEPKHVKGGWTMKYDYDVKDALIEEPFTSIDLPRG